MVSFRRFRSKAVSSRGPKYLLQSQKRDSSSSEDVPTISYSKLTTSDEPSSGEEEFVETKMKEDDKPALQAERSDNGIADQVLWSTSVFVPDVVELVEIRDDTSDVSLEEGVYHAVTRPEPPTSTNEDNSEAVQTNTQVAFGQHWRMAAAINEFNDEIDWPSDENSSHEKRCVVESSQVSFDQTPSANRRSRHTSSHDEDGSQNTSSSAETCELDGMPISI